MHNGQKKDKFLDGYFEFAKRDSGILCIPDFQGHEYAIPPSVHWIIQFEPPGNPSEYMFRVGRVCEENGFAAGKALLFLGPQEFGFLKVSKRSLCFHFRLWSSESYTLTILFNRDDSLSTSTLHSATYVNTRFQNLLISRANTSVL